MMAPQAFVFDGTGLLMRWSRPATAAAIYLIACAYHNHRIRRMRAALSPEQERVVSTIAVLHNILLVCFSAVVFVFVAHHFAATMRDLGLHAFLCAAPTASGVAPLSGPLHWWAYIFYLSKYYEMGDTVLLALRRKRIITLHAVHHALIPLTMVLLFGGRVSVSVVSMSLVNSFVHIVMYAYYLASALHMTPSIEWKRRITMLQILQFTMGVLGGSYYWFMYFQDVTVTKSWPFVLYVEGCAGGQPLMVLSGYAMNCVLFILFVRFYVHAYLRSPRSEKLQKQI
mmetsp:Transcript_16076/g.34893  ORF Transcript_16076/g.34893 Transcript_16076/m.34893 type:complete len:284 (-) Transcript_16076:24-875(-)